MGSPYVGEIRLFGASFAPAGWAMCNGALMPISENDTLFTLIGTTYGGDGQETFGLPDLQGRIPIHQGQGPGITQNYQIGEKAGVESVTLTTQQLPAHPHTLMASTDPGNATGPAGNVLANPFNTFPYFPAAAAVQMNANSLTPAGGNQPHENCMPFLVITYIISLFGVFPTQN